MMIVCDDLARLRVAHSHQLRKYLTEVLLDRVVRAVVTMIIMWLYSGYRKLYSL
jgi:hypothetical protein